jgi:hypothetical protein
MSKRNPGLSSLSGFFKDGHAIIAICFYQNRIVFCSIPRILLFETVRNETILSQLYRRLSIVFVQLALAQPNDLKVIKHDYYTSYFSIKQRIPVVLTYALTKSMVSCLSPAEKGRINLPLIQQL